MATSTTKTNKPILPRGNDQSPKRYNRAALYSGKALDFDGVNDKVEGSAPSLPTGANPFTTCFYYKETTTSNEAFSWGTMSTNKANGYRTATNKFKHFFYANDLESTIETPVGTWVFAAVTFDGTTRSIYINGQLDVSDTPTGVQVTGTDYKVGLATSTYFDGEISNVRIFNTALTAAQVADLYNNPEKIVPTGVEDTALKLWLPMMEGAGTTAYDGSGNGNHGTISGATYVNGVGAPVSQSAVMDWNKGVNLLTRSEEFLDADWVSQSSVTLTSGQDAPDGSTNAFKYNISAATSRAVDQTYSFGIASYTFAIYVKAIVDTTIRIRSYDGWSEDISINVADGWTRIDSTHTTSASSAANIGFFDASGSTGDRFYIWGASLEQASTAGPYVRTGATAQTSPVLLPQGLTTGRDITGVNLFENVRKQGALNLDGNSWAGVHDNASHDLSTAVTLEFWCKVPQIETFYTPQFIGKRDSMDANWLRMYKRANGDMVLEGNGGANLTTSTPDNTWTHFVATLDGTSAIIYKNGTSVATGSLSWTMVDTAPIGIGGWLYDLDNVANPNSLANGQIAQPRIYNRALTAEEVQRNYDAGKNIYK